MRIIIANYRYFIAGGPEKYMFKFMDAARKMGIEVIPFSVNNPQNEETPYSKYFAKNKLIEGGIPAEKIICVPTFIDSSKVTPCFENDKYFLFLGRMAHQSDQIWNPNWYHRFYYADYDQIQSRIISYAPSMGVNAIREEQADEIKRSLSRLSAVSVREKKGVALLKSLSLQEPAVVVDPTLLLDAKDWNAIFPTQKPCEEKYILSMFLTDNASHWRAAQIFAKSTGLKQIVIPYCGFSYFQNAEIKVDTGIQDFLNLIRGAEYILTDSFHVTVFSLIYRKQFYTFERFKEDAFSSQNERIRNILEIANVSDRLVPYGTNRIDFKNDIKYNAVVDTLNIEIEKSKVFLYKAIGNCK